MRSTIRGVIFFGTTKQYSVDIYTPIVLKRRTDHHRMAAYVCRSSYRRTLVACSAATNGRSSLHHGRLSIGHVCLGNLLLRPIPLPLGANAIPPALIVAKIVQYPPESWCVRGEGERLRK